MCELAEYQKIIDGLNGTCDGLHSHLDRVGREDLADNETFTAMLDDQIFECSECGWWCEQGEANDIGTGEDACNDCANEGDNDC